MAAAALEPRVVACVLANTWQHLLACLLTAATLLLGAAQDAIAHPMPESRIWVDTTPQGLRLTLQMPLSRLELAYGQPLSERPQQALQQHREALSRYLLQHVGARSGSQGWQALRPALTLVGTATAPELQAVMELRAPAEPATRELILLVDVITHEVRTHRLQVLLRQDWAGGQAGAPPQLLGVLDATHNTLPIRLQAASPGASLRGLFVQGARHIAEGTDHLLFLLTLLQAAPLAARDRRWVTVRRPAEAVRRLLIVVSAFTLGHTLTLAVASTGIELLPSAWVEAAVALSIVVAAWHACRPLLETGEWVIALGFGLLHGLAFAANLQGGGLTATQHVQALLAFNLGIEAVQAMVVACAMPPLLMLALRAPQLYRPMRIGVAAFAGAAASSWLMQPWWPDRDVVGWVESAAGVAPCAAAALWLLALIVWWRVPAPAMDMSAASARLKSGACLG